MHAYTGTIGLQADEQVSSALGKAWSSHAMIC
ncbi:hypothetical protein NBRC3188_2760 [Acetobacter pasteurianus NBRC 3188]|uniref:Uncharacterized protein n=1 Tax=Acetobacter pasteurianus NBRC 3188 TaxID=1226663 RepID=A0A401WXP2_ACEPA|nr:hypothetical protein NBRC3188_2760 [Acetobacter pasteurianus NBRC 3188]